MLLYRLGSVSNTVNVKKVIESLINCRLINQEPGEGV